MILLVKILWHRKYAIELFFLARAPANNIEYLRSKTVSTVNATNITCPGLHSLHKGPFYWIIRYECVSSSDCIFSIIFHFDENSLALSHTLQNMPTIHIQSHAKTNSWFDSETRDNICKNTVDEKLVDWDNMKLDMNRSKKRKEL